MNYEELKDLQSLPLKYKVMISQERIKEWYEYWDGKVYVSFSGGKDSTVLLHIVRELYPDVPAVFVDTGLEYPEIRNFVKTVENVTWLKPKMNFKQVIEKYGYPVISKIVARSISFFHHPTIKNEATRRFHLTGVRKDGVQTHGKMIIPEKHRCLIDAPFKVSDSCCYVMKKQPIKAYAKQSERHPIIGIMASEGGPRERNYLKNGGCNAFELKEPTSSPLGFWLESDVWEYIRTYNVPYSPIYDMGYSRTGCMFCMFGVHLEPEPNRFQMMQYTHPKLWEYCMFKLGLAEVLDYIGVRWNDNEQLWSTAEIMEEVLRC